MCGCARGDDAAARNSPQSRGPYSYNPFQGRPRFMSVEVGLLALCIVSIRSDKNGGFVFERAAGYGSAFHARCS